MIIHIDPGTAFGTGMHETTQLCIRQLKKHVTKETRILDVGCGSGILSVVALKYGAAHAFGTDLDPNAIIASHENSEQNNIKPEQFEVIEGNIIDDKSVKDACGYECYDIVCANILADVLEPLSVNIHEHMKEGAYFITSGIINTKENEVVESFKKNPELEKMVLQRKKKFVRYEEGAQLYSMGLHTFIRLPKLLMTQNGEWEDTGVKFRNQTSEEKAESSEVPKLNFKKFKNQTSRSLESKPLEVYFSNPNNTDMNNTDLNNNKSNPIVSAEDSVVTEDEMGCDDWNKQIQAYSVLIKENIGYSDLLMTHPLEKNLIDGIVDLILETVLCDSEKILIASNWYPAQLVKSKIPETELFEH